MNVLFLVMGFFFGLSSCIYSMEEYSQFKLIGRDGAQVFMPIYANSDSQTMQVAYNEYQDVLGYINSAHRTNQGQYFRVFVDFKKPYVTSNCKYLDTDQKGLEDVAQWFKLHNIEREKKNKDIKTTQLSDDRLIKLTNNISQFYPDNTILKTLLSDVSCRVQLGKIGPNLLAKKVQEALGLVDTLSEKVVSIKDSSQVCNEFCQEEKSSERTIVEKLEEQEVKPNVGSLRGIAQKYYYYFGGGIVAIAVFVMWKLNMLKR